MLEDRLEAVERELIRLNKTLTDLISLYVEGNTNPLLGDLPKASGFVPSIIKNRNKRRETKGQTSYTLPQLREIMNQAMATFDTPSIEAFLKSYNATCLADLPESEYHAFGQTLLTSLQQLEES